MSLIEIQESEVFTSAPGSLTAVDVARKTVHGTYQLVQDKASDALEGRKASLPGQTEYNDPDFPNDDALALIGRDRRLPRGVLEEPHAYAKRLRYWREAHKLAGTYQGMLYALRAVLVPEPPKIHCVRSGYQPPPLISTCDWYTLDDTGLRYLTKKENPYALGTYSPGVFWPADGSAPVPANDEPPDWDWDSYYWTTLSNPDPSRMWVIIEGPCNTPQLGGVEATYGDGTSVYGETVPNGDKRTIGTRATESYVTLARSVIREFKAPGAYVSMIIVSFTANLFDPLLGDPSDPEHWPDGKWKYHGKLDVPGPGPESAWVRARSPLARYFSGTQSPFDAPPSQVE